MTTRFSSNYYIHDNLTRFKTDPSCWWSPISTIWLGLVQNDFLQFLHDNLTRFKTDLSCWWSPISTIWLGLVQMITYMTTLTRFKTDLSCWWSPISTIWLGLVQMITYMTTLTRFKTDLSCWWSPISTIWLGLVLTNGINVSGSLHMPASSIIHCIMVVYSLMRLLPAALQVHSIIWCLDSSCSWNK